MGADCSDGAGHLVFGVFGGEAEIEYWDGMESGKLPDLREQIEVMEAINWLLVCLEGEDGPVWKVETGFLLHCQHKAFNVDLTGP